MESSYSPEATEGTQTSASLELVTSGMHAPPSECNSRKQSTIYLYCRKILNHRGLFTATISSMLFAFHNALIKYIYDDIHIMQISFVRYLFMFVIIVPVMVFRDISIKPNSRKEFLLHITRCSISTMAYNAYLYSLLFVSIGDATAVFHGSIVFVCVFARIILKESFGFMDFILTVVTMGGVFLMAQPPFLFGGKMDEGHSSQLIGITLALISAVGFALACVIQRYMTAKMGVSSASINIYYGIIASIETAVLVPLVGTWSMPCFNSRLILVAVGVIHCIAQYLLTYSLSVELAFLVTIVLTNEAVYAYLLEFLLFNLTPEVVALLGAGILLAAAVAATLRRMWVARKNEIRERTATGEGDHSPGEIDAANVLVEKL